MSVASSLRWWQWAVLGVVLSLAIGGLRRWAGPGYDAAGIDTVDPSEVEHLAVEAGTYARDPDLRRYHAGLPPVRGLTVHPESADDPGACWVTGEQFSIVRRRTIPGDLSSPMGVYGQWTPFKCLMPLPYRATLGAPGTYASLADYLVAVRKGPNPTLRYRVAWWEVRPVDLLLPAAVGLIGLGLLWPVALRLVVGPRPTEDVGPGWLPPPTAAPPAGPPPADGRLRDLNEAMAAGLAAAADPPPASPPSATPATPATVPIVLPTADPLIPVPAGPDASPAEYGGEFYPVVRPTAHRQTAEADPNGDR